jgi:hypothetical protein
MQRGEEGDGGGGGRWLRVRQDNEGEGGGGGVLSAGLGAFIEGLHDGSLWVKEGRGEGWRGAATRGATLAKGEHAAARWGGRGGGVDLSAGVAAVEQDNNLARFDDLSGLGSHL